MVRLVRQPRRCGDGGETSDGREMSSLDKRRCHRCSRRRPSNAVVVVVVVVALCTARQEHYVIPTH